MKEGSIRPNDDDPIMHHIWFFYPYDDTSEKEPLNLGASVEVWDKEKKEWLNDKVVKKEEEELTFQKRPDLFYPDTRIILYR